MVWNAVIVKENDQVFGQPLWIKFLPHLHESQPEDDRGFVINGKRYQIAFVAVTPLRSDVGIQVILRVVNFNFA